MTVPGPSGRFLYLFDNTAHLGVSLTGTAGQVGEFNPPAVEEALQELKGSAAVTPTVQRVGHALSDDLPIQLWADSALQGLLDDLHGVTAADRSDLRLLVMGMNGDTIGQKFEAGRLYLAKFEPKQPPAALTEVLATFKFTGAVEIGDILHVLSAATADGDTKASSLNNTASSANGGVAWWGYTALALDGGTGFAPRVIDSADNVTFGELAAFTAVTSTTGGGQRLAVTGTIEQYVACDWDFTGSPGAGATCTFWIGFVRL